MENETTHRPLIPLLALAMVPVLLVAGLLLRSPNFSVPDPDQLLDYPLGGDYLQEYVGGQLVVQPESWLYDASTFEQLQHDPANVGFRWEEGRFFPAVYPPFWYAAVSPLSQLSYSSAMRCWLVLMALALLSSLVLLHRFANVSAPLLAVLCLSPPVIESLSSGQKGTLLLLILSGTYLLLKRRQWFLSGLVFALIAFKPHLGVAIGLWMLVAGNWRWIAGVTTGLLLLIVASVACGSNLAESYLAVVLGFGDYVQNSGYELSASFSLWSFWQQLVGNPMASKILTVISSIAVLATSLIWFRGAGRQGSDADSLERAFAAMVIVTAVTSPHLYLYDLTMLLLPIGLLARIAIKSKPDPNHRMAWVPVGMLALLLFASQATTMFAAATNLQIGVLLLVGAWASIKRLASVEPEPTA